MISLLRKLVPKPILSFYHLALAKTAAFWYGNPSEKLIVIGVTGTNGKSTTVNMIASILQEAGYKVGLTSTINFRIAGQEKLNDLKMTMPGRFWLQRQLARMMAAGCRFAVIESSSEGIAQHRHVGIHYDAMVFTRLRPEHLERHGGFENYKQAKLEYFRHLERLPRKVDVPKVIVVNAEDEHSKDFLNFKVDQKITFSASDAADLHLKLAGKFNLLNAAAAIAVTTAYGVARDVAKAALEKIEIIPGRVEYVREGQPFEVMVDYAPEPNSLSALYETLAAIAKKRLIHVLGSTGGGRDRSRREVLGRMAGKTADIVVVTNEDPYDDDPQEIIDDVAKGALEAGKILGRNLFKILDRRAAIHKALTLAQPGDLVLLTGKGAEQAMVVAGGKKIKWDEREVVREELGKIVNQ